MALFLGMTDDFHAWHELFALPQEDDAYCRRDQIGLILEVRRWAIGSRGESDSALTAMARSGASLGASHGFEFQFRKSYALC